MTSSLRLITGSPARKLRPAASGLWGRFRGRCIAHVIRRSCSSTVHWSDLTPKEKCVMKADRLKDVIFEPEEYFPENATEIQSFLALIKLGCPPNYFEKCAKEVFQKSKSACFKNLVARTSRLSIPEKKIIDIGGLVFGNEFENSILYRESFARLVNTMVGENTTFLMHPRHKKNLNKYLFARTGVSNRRLASQLIEYRIHGSYSLGIKELERVNPTDLKIAHLKESRQNARKLLGKVSQDFALGDYSFISDPSERMRYKILYDFCESERKDLPSIDNEHFPDWNGFVSKELEEVPGKVGMLEAVLHLIGSNEK